MLETISAPAPAGQRRATVFSCTVVIVSWNTRELLAQCLHSLGGTHVSNGYAGASYRIVVVDNASTDGSAEMVRVDFPSVQLVANVENVGFARANNQAIRLTNSDYVLLLNPDTIVQAHAIQTLVDFLEATPRVGAAGADLRNTDGSQQESCFPEPSLSRELWRLLHLDSIQRYAEYSTREWTPPQAYPVDVVQGTCLLLRRAALEEICLLDEDYFIYSEEVDLCTRLRRAGWSVYWVPAARIVHLGGQSTRQQASRMFLKLYEGKVKFFRKHRGSQAATMYKFVVLLASLCRLLISPLILFEQADRRTCHSALVWKYLRLIGSLARM
jgi:GT2 family glycosyltransferase